MTGLVPLCVRIRWWIASALHAVRVRPRRELRGLRDFAKYAREAWRYRCKCDPMANTGGDHSSWCPSAQPDDDRYLS